MLTTQIIREKAMEYGADLVGFGDLAQMEACVPERDPRMILPSARTVLGFAFRVPRALYEAAERGYQFLNLTQTGIKNIDEELSEIFLLKMAALIENDGYDACVQRKVSNLKAKGDKTQNPEVTDTYELSLAEPVAEGKPAPEVMPDFAQMAKLCGMGEKGLSGSILTERFGPLVRFVFIITNWEADKYDAPFDKKLCDGCMACANACKGHAIDEKGLDTWTCSVYYRGAHESNPYMDETVLQKHPDRERILRGAMKFDAESARAIYPELNFLPASLTGYSPCLCGKACDLACYRHLKEVRKQ